MVTTKRCVQVARQPCYCLLAKVAAKTNRVCQFLIFFPFLSSSCPSHLSLSNSFPWPPALHPVPNPRATTRQRSLKPLSAWPPTFPKHVSGQSESAPRRATKTSPCWSLSRNVLLGTGPQRMCTQRKWQKEGKSTCSDSGQPGLPYHPAIAPPVGPMMAIPLVPHQYITKSETLALAEMERAKVSRPSASPTVSEPASAGLSSAWLGV